MHSSLNPPFFRDRAGRQIGQNSKMEHGTIEKAKLATLEHSLRKEIPTLLIRTTAHNRVLT